MTVRDTSNEVRARQPKQNTVVCVTKYCDKRNNNR